MYSVNAPIPDRVSRLAWDLAPYLSGFDAIRDRHTLVIKRLEANTREEFSTLERAARAALTGSPSVAARIADIDVFDHPAHGTGPVVYLVVESPGINLIHRRLTDRLGTISGIEGDEYVPHVTLARGGDRQHVDRLFDVQFDPIEWTITRLVFWDARRTTEVGSVRLPA